MKTSVAANVAIALAVLGWFAAYYGAMSQLGDPSPEIGRAVIEASRQRSAIIMCGGVFAVLSALWLAGYSFSGSRTRSVIALILSAVPFLYVAGQVV